MDSDDSLVLELRMNKECYLNKAQEALSGPFSTVYFDFTSTGLVLKVTGDTSGGGSFAVLQLSSKAFDLYSCYHEHFCVGLDLAAVAKIFSLANGNDIITIKYHREDGWSFPISLQSPGSCHFDFALEDAIYIPVGIPEYPESIYQAIVCMPSAKFKHFCDKLSCDTGDTKAVISISVDKDNVRFFTDKTTAIVRLQTQNGDKQPNEKISLTFGQRHLKNFSKASTLSDEVTIKLSSNLLVVEYKIAEMGYIRYHVMPADKEAEMRGSKRKI